MAISTKVKQAARYVVLALNKDGSVSKMIPTERAYTRTRAAADFVKRDWESLNPGRRYVVQPFNVPHVNELVALFTRVNADAVATGMEAMPFTDVEYYVPQIQNVWDVDSEVALSLAQQLAQTNA
jgi:hypothetical protein